MKSKKLALAWATRSRQQRSRRRLIQSLLIGFSVLAAPQTALAQQNSCPDVSPCTAIWPGGFGTWFGTLWLYPTDSGLVFSSPPSGPGVTAQISGGSVILNFPVLVEGVVLTPGGGNATLVVSSPANTLTTLSRMDVGFQGGTGTLAIQNGGVVNDGNDAYLGTLNSATGIATVTGAGSQWNISGVSYIGDYGQGILTISGAGQVNSSGAAYLGFQPGSSGSATVSGPGSQWNNSGNLVVGLSGNGTLTISNGGVVNSAGDGIGVATGSSGSVLVTGPGSQWNNSGGLGIGPGGTLTISAGGVVNDAGGIFVRANGAATVTGAGSQWNTGFIEVGFGSGGAALTIQNGGVVNSFNGGGGGFIGTFGGTGTVTVSGAGSQWNTGVLEVGAGGTGALTIQNGGVVSSTVGVIGFDTGSFGSVLVTGPGSQWNNSVALRIGSLGQGTLTVSAGGVVNDAGAILVSRTLTISSGGIVSSTGGTIGVDTFGVNTDSVGSVLVTGPGSQWNNSSGLGIGSLGQGTLTISAGGVVNNAGGIFVANGAATVTGAGSQWNTGFIEVGGAGGAGALTIQNSGVVNSFNGGGGGFIGTFGGTGTVTVNGAGSQWNLPFLEVGSNASGSLAIQNGGVVNGGGVFIGTFSGSSGSATVSGVGSQLITSNLCVGCAGQGSLTVQNGGTVTDQNANVGAGTGSGGNVLVDAGTWTTAGFLNIGINGDGLVTIKDGGNLTAGSMTIGSHGSLVIDPSIVTVLGDFTLMPGGLLSLDIAGTTPDLFSQLIIGGFGVFDGTIDFDFINGFAPHAGDQFDLITALGGADFSQASFQILGLQPGFEYTDTFSGGHFILTALNDGVSTTAAPEPGTLLLFGLALFTMMAVSMLQSRSASHPRRL